MTFVVISSLTYWPPPRATDFFCEWIIQICVGSLCLLNPPLCWAREIPAFSSICNFDKLLDSPPNSSSSQPRGVLVMEVWSFAISHPLLPHIYKVVVLFLHLRHRLSTAKKLNSCLFFICFVLFWCQPSLQAMKAEWPGWLNGGKV